MNKKATLLIFLLISGLSLMGQVVQNEIRLKWEAPRLFQPSEENSELDRQLLFFEEAIYPESDNLLPFFSTRLKLLVNNPGFIPSISLKNSIFEAVPDEDIRLIQDQISNSIEVDTWTQIERKQNYVRFEFLPIRRNQSTGKFERLVSFTPEIEWKSDPEPSVNTQKTLNYKTSSALADGKWQKISVDKSGIHKISYDKLIEYGFSDPENIRLFGNGGKQLPFDSKLDRPDDLVENPVHVYKGSDGTFNSGDYILFYARGVSYWKYDANYEMFVHRLHLYSDESFYYLSDNQGSGLRVQNTPQASGTSTHQVDSYDYYYFREKNSVNMIKSGRLWYGEHFNSNTYYGYTIQMENKVPEAPVEVLSSLLVRSSKNSSNSSFLVQVNESSIDTYSFAGVNTGNYEALYGTSALKKAQTQVSESSFELGYQFVQSNPAAMGWLDFFDINTRCNLKYNNKALAFRDIESTGTGNIAEFHIDGASSDLLLWDISVLGEEKSISYSLSGNSISFKAQADKLSEYILFNPASGDIPEPNYSADNLGEIENQNLHGIAVPDMVIIVQNELREQAEELAEIHKTHDQLDCLVLEPHQIYNEFSSGIPDPTAIRDFLKMLYSRGSGDTKLKYLLLFGDGSYDNKKASTDHEFRNCLPTYQSLESLYPTRSYVTDDYFGLLDNGEALETGLLDIGIGRFPVGTVYEAKIMVDKVRSYMSPETVGDWRNLICFIGDDEDGNTHMRDANSLATKIENFYPNFNVDKIFLDAYQQVVTAGGETYPEVNRAIEDRIKKGALIMNYLGHGSETGLAHENIITISDIQSWDNYDKLTIFMTATCEFSRFDDHDKPSAGEFVLTNSNGGGIGLFTTTRLVYSSPNFRLNREFYNYAFDLNYNNKKHRFGDLLRLMKNTVGSELNKLNFTLLADPALTLNYPEQKIIMTEINGSPIAEFSDTLTALSKVKVSGYYADASGNKLENYQGVVYPTVFDKEITLTTLSNDGGQPFEFKLQENIIFKGKSSITNGDFSYEFIVPKDIGYNVGTGKFSLYGTDGQTDGAGVNLNIKIGGSADSVFQDSDGPAVRLFMNDTSFVYGGTTNQDAILVARFSDDNGINTTGNGIGHDITAIIDGNSQDIIVLNDYYESDLDNYKEGTVRYPLNELEPGVHDITLKVWDILNNSSESEIRFEVFSDEQMILKNLINYPNPFTTNTAFYFEHNQAGSALDAQIQIYTVSGRLVKSFDFLSATENQIESGKFRVGPIYWDGLDQYGDRIGRGTYFYRVKIRDINGRTQEAFQKLVKL